MLFFDLVRGNRYCSGMRMLCVEKKELLIIIKENQ